MSQIGRTVIFDHMLQGLYPATVTPFDEELAVDVAALEAHLVRVLGVPGVNGVAVNGQLGEVASLTVAEQAVAVSSAVRLRSPGQLVIAGVIAQSLADTVAAGVAARDAGADALLVFPPFDSRPLRRLGTHTPSVVSFFDHLSARVGLPMVVFQYPSHSGSAYTLDTLEALCDNDLVVAIKAATPNITEYGAMWDRLHDRVTVLPAVDSPPLFSMLEYGAHGALIGISAICPERWVDYLARFEDQDFVGALEVHKGFCMPLMEAVFQNQLPTTPMGDAAGVKEALVLLGEIPSARVRPYTVGADPVQSQAIAAALRAGGVLGPAA